MKKLIVFVTALGIAAALAWLTGFNFDTRGPFVAYFSGLALVVATLAAEFYH